jgi:NF-X1-type zinc finger protein NFXL1
MSLIESNSTKLNLITGATFQGKPFKPSSDFITIQVTASYKGSNSGLLEIYYSIDGIYYDTYGDSWTFTTETNEAHIFKETQLKGSYFYVKWTNNGNSNYTLFNLYSKLTTTTSTVSVDGVINIPTVSVDIDGETVFARIKDSSNNSINSFEGNLNVIDNSSLIVLNDLNSKVPTGLNVTNNKLLCDVSGQTLNVDLINNSVNVDKVVEPIIYDMFYLMSSMYADSINGAIADNYGRDGWYWTNNSTTGGSNVYWYSNSTVPQNQMTKAEMDCVFIILALDRVKPAIVLPIVPMYSAPTGSGDIIPGFAHSRWTYTIPSNTKLNAGEVIMLTIGDSSKVADIRPELRRVELELNSTNGEALSTENIAYISLNTDSGLKDLNAIQYLLQYAGFHYSINDSIIEYEFSNSVKKLIENNLLANSFDVLNQINNKLPNGLSVSNNKLLCDVSGQRVITDISGQTLKVNTISGFALDSSVATTNTKLDTLNTSVNNKHLFFTNDSVTIGDISSGAQVGINNFPFVALDATLVSTNNKLDTLNTTVTNKTLNKNTSSIDISGQFINISNLPLIQDVSGSVSVSNFPTSTQVSNIVDVSGNVSVSNFPGSFEISNLPSTQDVSGNVSVSNFPTSFEISNLPSTQDVSGSVSVSNFPTSFEISNLPSIQDVSGNVNVSNIVDVSGNVSVSNFPTSFEISNLPSTQDVSGSVSVSNVVDVSGSVSVSNVVDVSGSVSVSNVVDVSGSVSVSNFPTSFEISNLPSIQDVSGSVSVSNFPTSTEVSNIVDVSGNVSVSNFPTSTEVSNIVDVSGNVNITNSSIDTHLKSFHSGSWVNVVSASNGHLLVNSSTQDGDGNDITSSNLGGGIQALDVNIRNNAEPVVIDFANPSIGVTGSVTVDNFPTVQSISGDVNITNTSITVAGSVSANITNSSLPVTGTFYQATQPVSLASNVGIKDSSGNSIKADPSGNLNVNVVSGSITVDSVNIKDSSGNNIKADGSGNLNTAMQAFNRTNNVVSNLTTVQPVGASSSVKALETYSYIVAVDNGGIGLPLQLTSTQGLYQNSLDTYINNGTTVNTSMSFPNVGSGTGLNMYVIPSKTKTFLFNAYSNNTNTNAAIASIGNTQAFTANNWGLANPRSTWAVYRTGTTAFSFYYTYINASGNEVEVVAPLVLTASGTFYSLASDIITVNSWKLNSPLGAGDTFYITSAGTTASSYGGGNTLINSNSLWTCPNNCIAWVQNINCFMSGAEGIRLFKWDEFGNRSVMYQWLNASNFNNNATGEYGFGGYITAGQTIGWGGENSSIVRNISANIVCRYL